MRKNLIQTGVEGVRRLFYLIPARPEVAQIEITNKCNFNCPMCQRTDLKVPIEDMDFEVYKKIINRLDGVKEVILTGWGEPLLHPRLVEMVKYAKKKGKSVSLTSNGALLTIVLARNLIQAGLDSISFSIDEIKAPGGSLAHPVTTQIKNIENSAQLFSKTKSRPAVIIQTTLHQDGEDKIFEVIAWAKKIGADMVNINRLDMRFNPELVRPSFAEEKEFVKKLDEVGRKYKIQTEFRPHIAFWGISRVIYRTLAPFMALGGRHCLRVYNYVYVNLVGEITPCCALPLWSVGNLLKEDLSEIWRSEKFGKFRQHEFQRKICGKCDVLEVKQYT